MAYVKLSEVICVDKKELFCRLRDFLCKRNGTYDYSTTGIGWTLHDSSYAVDEDNPQANDYFVIYSAGESGKEQLYFKIIWSSASYIDVYGYLYWNNSTHVGVVVYGSSNGWILNTTNPLMNLIVYGDLDKVFCLSRYSTIITTGNFNGFHFGKYPPIYGEDDTVVRSTGNLSAGTGVAITLVEDIPSSWKVGQKIFIWDQVNAKVIQIITLDAGTKTITATLAQSFTGTISLSHIQGYKVQSAYNPLGAAYYLIGDNNTNNFYCGYAAPAIASQINPSILNSEYGLENIVWAYSNHVKGISGIFKSTAITAGIDGDVFVDRDGNYYTKYLCHSNAGIAVLEP